MLGGVQALIPLQNMPDFFSVFPQNGREFREARVTGSGSNFKELLGKRVRFGFSRAELFVLRMGVLSLRYRVLHRLRAGSQAGTAHAVEEHF